MSTRPRLCALFLVTILAPVIAAHAANRAGSMNVRLQILENSIDAQQVSRCEIEGDMNNGDSKEWCLFYGEVQAHPGTGWEGMSSRSGCGEGRCGTARSATSVMRGSPYVTLDVSVGPAPPRGGSVQAEASILLRRLTGFSSDGKPVYQESREKRVLEARQGEDTLVPVLLADPREKEAFGANDIVLRCRARDLAQWPSTDYGKVSVDADVSRADILLDGGVVGHTTEGTPTLLSNVPVGDREVIVRDVSGREVRKVARVMKDKTAEVAVKLLPPTQSPAPHGGLIPLGKNPQGQDEYWREKDGALVVRIPAGGFRMGSREGEGEPQESPQHEVNVSEFLMDKTEVTWAQFKKFSEATSTPLWKASPWGMPHDYPVTSVLWEEARAFCEWAGGRLPTEAEWEKAARGTDERLYPWGNEWEDNRCNTRDGGPHRPMAVGIYPDCISPYGVLDMCGSVWEWCEDWYDERSYAAKSPGTPQEPASEPTRANRGGSWLNPNASGRTAYRQGSDPTWRDVLRGFRCVQNQPQDPEGGPRPEDRRDDSGKSQDSPKSRPAEGPTAPVRLQPSAAVPGGATSAATVNPESTASLRNIEVHLETVSNPMGGGCSRCAAVAEVPLKSKRTWWSTVGEVRPRVEGGWDAVGVGTQCGVGSYQDTGGAVKKTKGSPYLIVETEILAVRREDLMVSLVVTVSTRKLSGFTPEMKPIYETSNETRTLRLDEREQAVLPAFVRRDSKEQSAIHDVLVRIKTRRVTRPGATAYGVLSVTSDVPDAEILLDGGVAARVGQDEVAVLKNVRAGEREVSVRDASGRETPRRIVDVLENQTVTVALSSSGSPSLPANALVPSGKNPEGYETYRRKRDGATMVRIPEGEFLMGNLQTESSPLPHKVTVSTFLIDKTPVTWGQYEKFAQATRRALPPEPFWGIHGDHSVSFLTWEESRAYCEWVGGRLPTEAEREKAARGTDDRKYPWGNEEPTPDRGVFRHNWGYEATEPVGTHPAGASPYGLLDMGGNCWEWCEDWYDPDYYQTTPGKDPRGPGSGRAHVVRGGSWDSRPTVLSCSCRNWGFVGYREGDFGFRCAADPPR